jgi:CRISPR-associated endoribonuclease Cas6
MRIHIITTPNREKVSFSYQHRLADILHKWLDINGNVILHSFSWLLNAEVIKGGLSYPNGSKFFIGFHDSTHLQQIVDSIMSNVDLCYGMKVIDVRIEENPDLTYKTLFRCASPIFIRRNEDDAETNYTYHDENAGQLMEETLQRKME